MDRFPPGLYESLVTLGLRDAITALTAAGWEADLAAVDEALISELLADHVREAARHSIESVAGEAEERLAARIDLVNRLLATLREGGAPGSVLESEAIAAGGQELLEVRQPGRLTTAQRGRIRPHISLRESALLVNAHRDYQIGSQVGKEIASADAVDLLSAFVRFAGLSLVRDELDAFTRRGGRLRVIASVYTGTTEKRALDDLVRLGAQVKVSYETSQTRLHAKAWLFARNSGFHTAYIGSSNLTHTALVEGLEWNVRVSAVDNANIVERVRATFEQYWNDPAFVAYDPERDGATLAAALAREQSPEPLDAAERLIALNLDLTPLPHQSRMLEELDAERRRGHFKNLVVAATGTGKTWVSAFDYRRLRSEGSDRLLFVAHRDEILTQTQLVFQVVLRDASFGERFVADERPITGDHVFASIQSLHRHIDDIDPAAWDVVIVDEFHHAEAATYRRLLDRLQPRILIGLTATPERADAQSILHWFDDRVATELRLWEALDQGLLSPFHYFGVNDGSDLRSLVFSRGKYGVAELEAVYISDRERVTRILDAVRARVVDPGRMRALGFCVSVAHAEAMAVAFDRVGIRSVALHAHSPSEVRRNSVGRLRRGELQAIFTVDLFNEGIDIPEVDTVLFLRPTDSATVFLQQLGRGLRRAPEKSVLTVLDFVGQAHKEYRYDLKFRALLGGTRQQVARAVEEGFPVVPPGCSIKLDRLSQGAVLANVKSAAWATRKALAEDLASLGPNVRLPEFLKETGHDLEDVYSRPAAGHSFTSLRRQAFPSLRRSAAPEPLDRALGRLLHIDDDERLATWTAWLEKERPPAMAGDSRADRLRLMLFGALGHRRKPTSRVEAELQLLWADDDRKLELYDLLSILRDRTRANTIPLAASTTIPLNTHGTYGLYEIIAAYRLISAGGVLRDTREGVLRVEEEKTDIFFVTLQKGDSDYSPTTRYQDYPISESLFHWESQSTTSPESPTGERYINHRQRGDRILLFVRERKRDGRGETVPYTCLGFARYVSHESGRPIRFVWQLERPMPAGIYEEAKVAAG